MKKGIIAFVFAVLTNSVYAQMSVSYGEYHDCTDASKSKIWAKVVGGTPPYEYSWNNGPYISNDTLYTPVRANQRVIVRDAMGLTATRISSIGGLDTKGNFSVATRNPDLSICPNPQVEATIDYYSYGSTSNTFDWSDGSQDVNNGFVKTVTAPLDYMVTITTSSGCLFYDTLRIVPDSTFHSSIDIYRPYIGCGYQRCIYATPSDSFLDPYVIQPTGPYSYEWSTNAIIPTFSTDAINCDIMSYASYSVTVTTASGCTSTATMADIGNIDALRIWDVIYDTASCTNQGSVSIFIEGGVAPVSAHWIDNSFIPIAVDSGTTATNLPYAGVDYLVYLEDAEGCWAEEMVHVPMINNIEDIEPSFNVVYDNCAGTSCVDITYNVPDQSMITHVEWYNSDYSQYDTTRNFCTNGGSQTIEVYTTTRYYCQVSDTLEITLPSMLGATASATPASCGNDGSVTCTPVGGTVPYTFTWNNGSSTATASNLPAGNYSVTVVDGAGCTATASTVIASAQLVLDSVGSTPATCATAPDGGAYISVSSATPPVNYVWSNGAVTSTISNVLPGNYTVTATDGNGCSMVQSLVIGETGLRAQTTQQVPLNCLGTGATLQVTPLNGYAPYNYQWSNGSIADTAANLIEDNYRVTVTDNYGCTVATGQATTFAPGCVVSLSGRVYSDSDQSCAFDNLDVGLSNKVVVIEPGYTALTDYQGFWHIDVLLNPSYKVYVSPAGTVAYSICNIDTVVVPASTSIPVSNIDFPKSSSIINNVSVRLACGIPRPGFSQMSTIIISNYGVDSASGSGTVTLDVVIDSVRLLNIGYGITIDSISSTVPRIVYFSYTNLPPQQTTRFELVSLIPTLPNVSLGQILDVAASVNMGNVVDQAPSDNTYSCSMEIRGAYDPNDKQVFSIVTGESIDGPTSVGDSVLRYLIRFQNTGTDTAFNVLIKDTLHPNLNIHTFQLLATSHPVEVEFKRDSIIHFSFNNILLPDSNVNEPASHGFVEFTLEVTDPAQLEELTNQASIFFDFNPPIYTNTVATQRNYYPCLYPATTYETVASQTICHGDSYRGYSSSGTYRDTFVMSIGCDSISVLNLTVLPPNVVNYNQTICAGQSFEGHNASGIYADTLTAANGCDSIRLLNLTVSNAIVAVLNETVCFGDSYLGYSTSGTFSDTLSAASGCDSVRQLNLTVLPSISTTLNAAICDGDSIYVGGASQTVSGIYTDILASATGCDSIVETILTVNALPNVPQIVQSGSELSVDATGLAAFQWYLDGTVLPNETNSALTVAANGTYHVVVFDANSCSSTSGTIQVTGVSVNDIAQLPLSIFPNPTTGKLTVNVGGAVVEKLELYNALGQQLIVVVSNIGTGQVDVDASEFASGVYMIRILIAGVWQQERVVIAK